MSGSRNTEGGRDPAEPPKAKKSQGDDECDLAFELDLSATRPALRQIANGATLDVDLIAEGNLEAVVCRRQGTGDIVGSLAAFEGLTQLIDCIRRRNRYVADVIRIAGSNCTVRVRRVRP
ncbi:hypothetical protein QU42_19420 [Bradyrhizobium sp. UASWS1016]|jgi:hypothetical protein|nr:hypothetical protein QU42_19420 [Bradyrhizobium sp. UASWS1016]